MAPIPDEKDDTKMATMMKSWMAAIYSMKENE